jgi:apolipoprotein N-acyltransferase
MYVKQRPVPFGEFVPFRPVLTRIIGRFDRIPRDFIAGDTSGVLQVGNARLGDVICFEVAYDDVVRNTVRDGGRALAVQTNNATFAGLGQPEQQVAMSRLRAVETGRTVLVAATSGISAVIDPTGGIQAELGEDETGWIVQPIELRDSQTIATRVGEVPEFALCFVALVGLGWVLLLTVRRSSSLDRDTDQAEPMSPPTT